MQSQARRFSRRLAVLIAAASLLAFVQPLRTSAADATPVKGQRVFSAGHSFHYWMPPILANVATNAGIAGHVQVGLQPIGGSRVIQHWDLPDEKNKVKPALKTGEVDVLTLSPIYLPDAGIENFAKLALEHNPAIRLTVQEFWLPFESVSAWTNKPKSIDRDSMTVAQLRAAHADYFKSMDAHVTSLNKQLGKQVIFVVPSGQAVIALREKIIKGEAPGIAKQSEIFTDVLGHVNAPIMVLATYCHFAVIYKRSPAGLPVPAALAKQPEAEKLNRLLQELAWDAVTKHPLSGVKR
ncbi:MAG: hypothetical protein HY301_16455 [Verrucomicrobia bacterium]|nr:hypothetical protein [Verrucomicrobiota bacterium]